MDKKRGSILAGGILIAAMVSSLPAVSQDYRWIKARDVHPELRTSDDAALGLTTAIIHDKEFIYIADRSDGSIKVYEKNGRLRRTIGRRGQGPGEFNPPSGLSVLEDKLYVADGANGRIQILTRDGRYLSSFKVPFRPSSVVALDKDTIAVSYMPSFLKGKEKMIHAFSPSGEKIWEGLEPAVSGDSIFDTMRNRFDILRGEPGGILAVFKSDEIPLRRFAGDGRLEAAMPPPRGYPIKGLRIPFDKGRAGKNLSGFSWAAALSEGKLFVLSPARTEEGDLGPGVEIYVFVPGKEIEGVIELPVNTLRFSVDGNRIYAVDADQTLRVFQFEGL